MYVQPILCKGIVHVFDGHLQVVGATDAVPYGVGEVGQPTVRAVLGSSKHSQNFIFDLDFTSTVFGTNVVVVSASVPVVTAVVDGSRGEAADGCEVEAEQTLALCELDTNETPGLGLNTSTPSTSP
ncbi:hypothetical protein EYF80_037635 [Liparis tanakae]|uniref:Uncharacterized protein n=1 Tax=Liparis tanakae TaxID=230148 RepID=A0A4Z2GGZ8_9TELE|nr:hypothetical protein EYF80_037635 [Liparis tanakae]